MHTTDPRSRFSLLVITLLLALGSGVSQPVTADQLPLRDGRLIETRGPWKVESNRILYRDLDGNLRSIRLSEVDLARPSRPSPSRRRTPDATNQPAFRITDESLARTRASQTRATATPARSQADTAQPHSDQNAQAPSHDPTTFLIYDEMALLIDERYRAAIAGAISELAHANDQGYERAQSLLDSLGERIEREYAATRDVWRAQALWLLRNTVGAQGPRARTSPAQLQRELGSLIATSELRATGARRRQEQLGR